MTLRPADPAFADSLRDRLDPRTFRDPAPRYLEEPRGTWAGHAGLILAPADVTEVSLILAAANAAGVPVVPYGGGTGLVGGQIMPDGPAPLLLLLERMTAIRKVDPVENVAVVEAGVILEDIHRAAEAESRLFPLSLAAKGSARIGGNLATNAGGVNVLRYGNARDLCLGIEAVLPDGRIWNGLTRLRKDNTGYDLRNLLIGSEGSLGVITAAALKLSPRPAQEGTALFAVPSVAAAIALLNLARDQLGELVSAFELIHVRGLEFLAEHFPHLRQPFDEPPQWSVLVDLGLIRGMDPVQALTDLFEAALDRELAEDGVVANSEAQRQALWTLREHIPEGNRQVGAISSHDISVPIAAIPEFVQDAEARIARLGPGDMRINCFGHIGDGNLHFNVFPAKGKGRGDYAGLQDEVKTTVHDLVKSYHGSFSAEHGVGRLKTQDLQRYGDPVKLAMMRQIKSALDPKGIMNPGAVLSLPA